jgi:hypothetical protein
MSDLSVWEIRVPDGRSAYRGAWALSMGSPPQHDHGLRLRRPNVEVLSNFEIYLLRQRGLSPAAGAVMLPSPLKPGNYSA